jgi:hypothetical protein
MSEPLLVALLNFGVRFGLDAAVIVAEKIGKPGATIDDAITALRAAQTKTAADYLAADKMKG